MYRQGLPASMMTELADRCYYAQAWAPPPGCLQRSNVDIVMVGRRAAPKWLRVCEACAVWLLQERQANVALPLRDVVAARRRAGICLSVA